MLLSNIVTKQQLSSFISCEKNMAEISCMWFPTNGNSLAVFCSIFSDTWQPFDKGRAIIFPLGIVIASEKIVCRDHPCYARFGEFF